MIRLGVVLLGLVSALAVAGAVSADPVTELLPDYDQRAPHSLAVTSVWRAGELHFRLGFGSAADNVGVGPMQIRASRRPGEPVMVADQLVRLSNGRFRRYRAVGQVRYVRAATHQHWHFSPFERYELRRAGVFELLVRDGKMGFCLADHFAWRVGAQAHFVDWCGFGVPSLLRIGMGTSPGYSDHYFPFVEGQWIELTGLAAGRYLLVHRVNPDGLMRESDYSNNAASVLIRLSWPNGRHQLPRVHLLAVCQDSERCDQRR